MCFNKSFYAVIMPVRQEEDTKKDFQFDTIQISWDTEHKQFCGVIFWILQYLNIQGNKDNRI